MLSLVLRIGALASLADSTAVVLALVAAHAGARATMPMMMLLLPRARADGLSAQAGRPPLASAMIAALIGAGLLVAGFGVAGATVAMSAVVPVFAAAVWLYRRQIGGQTGDTLGALEQIAEIAILMCAAAR